jgi:hypothetical protein
LDAESTRTRRLPMNRRVLIVGYYSPPMNGPVTRHPTWFFRYLPLYGLESLVISSSVFYDENLGAPSLTGNVHSPSKAQRLDHTPASRPPGLVPRSESESLPASGGQECERRGDLCLIVLYVYYVYLLMTWLIVPFVYRISRNRSFRYTVSNLCGVRSITVDSSPLLSGFSPSRIMNCGFTLSR